MFCAIVSCEFVYSRTGVLNPRFQIIKNYFYADHMMIIFTHARQPLIITSFHLKSSTRICQYVKNMLIGTLDHMTLKISVDNVSAHYNSCPWSLRHMTTSGGQCIFKTVNARIFSLHTISVWFRNEISKMNSWIFSFGKPNWAWQRENDFHLLIFIEIFRFVCWWVISITWEAENIKFHG